MDDFVTDIIFKLSKASSYEEFMCLKDMYVHKKKLNQHETYYLATMMAAQCHDSKLICRLIRENKVVTIGEFLKNALTNWLNSNSFQNYIKKNLKNICVEVMMYFPPT